MATDPFASLRPKKEDVPVGDSILSLRTATLDQEQELLSAISDLDLGSLFAPLADILGGETTISALLGKAKDKGTDLWSAAQTVLGRQLAPALQRAAIALLATPQNATILHTNNVITSGGGFNSDGLFSCPELRTWLRREITLVQATYILKTAWGLNGYGEALGNLIPLAVTEEPAAEEPTTQDSNS